MCAAYDRDYLPQGEFGTTIRKGIVAFIKSMVKQGSGVKHLRKEKKWSDEVWEMYERITGEQRPALFRNDDHT